MASATGRKKTNREGIVWRLLMVSALITFFHPKPEAFENALIIARQVDRCFICDNTPRNTGNEDFSSAFSGAKNVVYLPNNCNLGLSCAFNRVLKNPEYSFSDDEFILFFDQDSRISEKHVTKMMGVFSELEKTGEPIGALGPSFYSVNNKSGIEEVLSIITSSFLTKYRYLVAMNFWNERIFLDVADYDISYRVRAIGKKVFKSYDIRFEHSLGNSILKVGKYTFVQEPPIRVYYRVRDILKLLKEPYVPSVAQRYLKKEVYVYPLITFWLFPQKLKRLRYYVKGIVDYLRRQDGCL